MSKSANGQIAKSTNQQINKSIGILGSQYLKEYRMTISAPRWDLTNVYPSLESQEFQAAVDDYKKQVAALEKFFKNKLSRANAKTKAKDLAPLVGKAIDQINKIQTLSGTISPFIYSYVSTNSRDKVASKTLSEFEQASLPM